MLLMPFFVRSSFHEFCFLLIVIDRDFVFNFFSICDSFYGYLSDWLRLLLSPVIDQ